MDVLIMMGSDSDLPVMEKATVLLKEMGVSYRMHISSAHRTPERTVELIREAEASGAKVIIAGAGGAAHLPGVIAAYTTLPVIGVPLTSWALDGMDALLSIAQMPPGIPVATVAINGAKNAALLAVEILAIGDSSLKGKLLEYREKMAMEVIEKDRRLERG